MGFDWLSRPLEALDAWLEGLMHGAPPVAALLVALVLGLRHASDPDHLLALTSLVSTGEGDVRAGVRLGAWWGAGHAATLVAVGTPLILARAALPAGLERAAEVAIGVTIVVLAVRLLVTWPRRGRQPRAVPVGRLSWQAGGIGVLHGLGGTGAVALLLVAGLPGRGEALAALWIFAAASLVSMAACSGAYAWLLTRRRLLPAAHTVVVPAVGVVGVLFGAWYAMAV
ncbi:MAG: hypothetical protein AB1416_06255 [Actinomycetota bacterium]